VPGKIMYVKAGVYVEAIDTGLQPMRGGDGPSYSTATTIEGFGSDVVTIKLPTGRFLPLYLNNGGNDKYLLFRKLIFDADNQPGSNGVGFGAGGHHMRFENCEVKNSLFEGVYVYNASNIELYRTSIHQAGAVAVQLHGTLDGFLCQECSVYDAVGGINWTFSGDTGPKSNIVIRESIIQNHTGTVIDAGISTGALVQNSLISDSTGIGVRVRTGATGTKIYSNTIATLGGVGLQCDAGATGVELINDILWGNTGGNLANLCGATLTTTTYTVDPLFAPGTYTLADGSPAIDKGTTIPSQTVDLLLNPRQQGPQDQGAYERTQTPTTPGTSVTVRPPALFQAEMFF